MILLNISGHPVPRVAVDGDDIDSFDVIDIDVPTVDFSTTSFQDAAMDLLADVQDAVDSDVLRRGDYQVILPGMAPLAMSLVALLHGISGSFPVIRASVRVDGNFKLSSPTDLQQVRLDARDLR